MGEATPPIEQIGSAGRARIELLSLLATKLYSGSVAGAISRTLTAPIDRLKMVMQFDLAAAESGMLGVARQIYAEGGATAFFVATPSTYSRSPLRHRSSFWRLTHPNRPSLRIQTT